MKDEKDLPVPSTQNNTVGSKTGLALGHEAISPSPFMHKMKVVQLSGLGKA